MKRESSKLPTLSRITSLLRFHLTSSCKVNLRCCPFPSLHSIDYLTQRRVEESSMQWRGKGQTKIYLTQTIDCIHHTPLTDKFLNPLGAFTLWVKDNLSAGCGGGVVR